MVKSTKLYNILQVSFNSDSQTIKKAYHKLALEYHPDKINNGNEADRQEREQKFKEISEAYRILSDTKLRQHYDLFGAGAGVDEQMPSSSTTTTYHTNTKMPFDPEQLFSSFFGANGPFGPQGSGNNIFFSSVNKPFASQRSNSNNNNMKSNRFKPTSNTGPTPVPTPKAEIEPININIQLTLRESYLGVERSIEIERKIECQVCSGLDQSQTVTCQECRGTGQLNQSTQMSAGVAQRVVSKCFTCNGVGVGVTATKTMPMRSSPSNQTQNHCIGCNKKGYIIEKVNLTVALPPGTKDKETIVSKNRGHFKKGNVLFNITVTSHHQFTRHGEHLIFHTNLSLAEALIGGDLEITHLSGERLLLTREQVSPSPHQVIQPELYYQVAGYGFITRDKRQGDLFIKFKINFPKTFDLQSKQELTKAFKFTDRNHLTDLTKLPLKLSDDKEF